MSDLNTKTSFLNPKQIAAYAAIIIILAGAFGVVSQNQVSVSLNQISELTDHIDQLERNITNLQNQLDQPVGSTLSASRKTASFVVSFATNSGVPAATLVVQSGVNGSMITLGSSATNYTYVAEKAIDAAAAINGSVYFCEGNYAGMTIPDIPLGVSVTIDSGAYGYILSAVYGTLTDYSGSVFYTDGQTDEAPYSYLIYQKTVGATTTYYAKASNGSISWSSTNATTTIQSAADTQASDIFIKEGTYDINTITLDDNQRLHGVHSKTILNINDDLPKYSVYGFNFSAGITNDNHLGNTGITIEGITINFQGDTKDTQQGWGGIWLVNASNSYVKNNIVYDVVMDAEHNYGEAYGINFLECTDSFITNNIVHDAGYECIGARGLCDNIWIENNLVWGGRIHGIQASRWSPSTSDLSYETATNIHIVGNTVNDTITQGDIKGQIINDGCSYIFIEDNTCASIKLNSHADHTYIIGNNVVNGQITIFPQGATNIIQDVLIAENTITGFLISEYTTDAAINVNAGWWNGGTVSNLRIIDNEITSYLGIRLATNATDGLICNITIAGNEFHGTAGNYGLLFTDFNVHGLMLVNNRADFGVYLLRINLGAQSDFLIQGNDVGELSTVFLIKGVDQDLTNYQITNNIGFVTENTLTSITNTTATTFVFNHGLKSTANSVICSFDAATAAAIQGYSWTSSTTQVTVTVYAASGQTLPASMTILSADMKYIVS